MTSCHCIMILLRMRWALQLALQMVESQAKSGTCVAIIAVHGPDSLG